MKGEGVLGRGNSLYKGLVVKGPIFIHFFTFQVSPADSFGVAKEAALSLLAQSFATLSLQDLGQVVSC